MGTRKSRELELKVGLTVGIALILLAITIFTVEKFHFGESGYEIEVAFNFVDALKPQSDVKIGGGVKIGHVSEIVVEKELVVLKVVLDKDVRLPKTSKFQILSKGVMGDKYLNVVAVPTTEDQEFIKPGERMLGVEPANIDKAFQRLGQVADSIKLLLGDPELTGSFSEVMKNFGQLSGRLDALLKKNENNIDKGIKDISEAASSIKRFSNDIESVTKSLDELLSDKNMKNMGSVFSDLQNITSRLDTEVKRIEEGKGTLGVLIHDEQIGEDIKTVIKDVKKHPWKLFWKQ